MSPNGNTTMADTDSKNSRSLRLIKALEDSRAQHRPVQPAKESSVFKGIKAASKTQSAIKFPNQAAALRRVATEAQNAGSKESTAFRLRITPRPTSSETVTLQRKPLGLKRSSQPVERPAEPVSLPGSVSTLPADLRTVANVSDVGELVRGARKRQGMTQGHLAALAGTGRRFISDLEAGKPTLEFERMLKVCGVLSVELFAKVRNDGG